MRVVDLGSPLGTPLNRLIKQWRDPHMVLRQSPPSGERSGHDAETPEGRNCEVTRTVDPEILRDLP
jgi:hypothetical protein